MDGSIWRIPNRMPFVFSGATGDLAYEQIFPALQAMIQRGHFDMPTMSLSFLLFSLASSFS